MKQGTLFTKVAMGILLVGVLVYLFGQMWQSLRNPFSTTYAYTVTEDISVEADGIIAREESVLDTVSGVADLQLDEGEKVAVGGLIANIYADSSVQDLQKQVDSLTEQQTQLQAALDEIGSASGTAHLDDTILENISLIRYYASHYDFAQLDGQISSLKSNLLLREYSFDENSASTLQEQIDSISVQISDLEAQIGDAVSAITASESGTFSALVDGYETKITPENMYSFTPSSLRSLLEESVQEDTTSVGKLITDSTWYFVAIIQGDPSQLTVGDQYSANFSGTLEETVPLTAVSVGEAADGEYVAIFETDGYLEQTTLLRKQTVDIIEESITGIRVPLEALRFNEENQAGVYVLVGARAEFKPVNILYENDEYCIVSSVETGSTSLRDGDEIIVDAKDLYDQKIVL